MDSSEPKKRRRILVKKKKRIKLPQKLLYVPSCDKDFIEKWTKGRDPLNFPASFRIILCGKPGCSKTMMLKNIVMRVQSSKKPFERIIVLHQDKRAREYDDIDATIVTELPENDFWMGYDDEDDTEEEDFDDEDLSDEEPYRPKTLMVIDDICFRDMPRRQTVLLDRLCGFISTHCNVSLAVLNQDVFAIDPIIRKCCNVWCIWKPSDNDQLMTISRRCGLRSKDLEHLFEKYAPGELDSIMVDQTPRTPYPLRLNGFTVIEKE